MITLAVELTESLAPAVKLDISSDSTLTKLLRSDRNGVSPVRANLALSNEKLIIEDYEPAYGSVTYSLTNATGETIEKSLTIKGSLPVLHNTSYPTQWVQVTSVTSYTYTRQSGTVINQGITSKYPSIAYALLRSRNIEITITASTYRDIVNIENVLSTPGTLFLRQSEHDGLDTYIVVNHVSVAPSEIAGTNTIWQITAQCVEAAPPAGTPAESVLNNYGSYINIYALYVDSATAHSTYLERLRNE